VAHPHGRYQPRDTEHSVLHAVIREHLEPFLREVSDRRDGSGLPRFVEQEFREFLTCGVFARAPEPIRSGRGGAGLGWGGAGTLPRVGEGQVREDLSDDGGLVQRGDQAPPAPTMSTGQDINAERPEMGATRGATAAGAC
jgi:hypothetical protein